MVWVAIKMVPGDHFSEMQSCSYPQTLWVRITLYFIRLFFKQQLHHNNDHVMYWNWVFKNYTEIDFFFHLVKYID